jgi:Fibronectin type III domain
MSKASATAGPANETSGFGHPEAATPVEVCPDGTCGRSGKPSVTDLYCPEHGRFLPLIGQSARTRTYTAIAAVIIGYGLIEITALTGSAAAIYVLYSAIFLCFIAIPLRHFATTAISASLLWLTGSFALPAAHATSSRLHMIAVGLIIAVAAIVAVWNTLRKSLRRIEIPYSDWYRDHGPDADALAKRVAVALVIATWSTVTGLTELALPHEGALAAVMLVVAAFAVGIGAFIVSVSAGVIGAGSVSTDVTPIPSPRRPTRPHTPGDRDGERRLDSMIDVLAWRLYSVGVTAGYCIVLAGYGTAVAVIAVANLVIRAIVVTARWAWASMGVAAIVTWAAMVAVGRGAALATISVLVPAFSLLGTPWIVSAAAVQSRRYLLNGPIAALWLMFALLLVCTLLVLGTWVILANQHPRESFRSAGRSAASTASYVLPVAFIGAWVTGIPGSLGYGQIRLGPVTYVLTGCVAIVTLLYALHRARPVGRAAHSGSGTAAALSPPDQNDLAWSVCTALTMIAGAAIAVALLVPVTLAPLAPPTGLTARTWTTTSATITWTRAASGPDPDRYVVERDGRTVGTVPGSVTTFHALGLAPGTTHVYQVSAVLGADRSPASNPVKVRNYLPPVWQASLNGAWSVRYTNVTAENFNFKGAELNGDRWTFTKNCTAGQCPMTVVGFLHGSGFQAKLQLTGQVYSGQFPDNEYIYCSAMPENAIMMLTINVVRGAIVEGRWNAIAWSGSLVLKSTPTNNCTSSTITADISAG